MWNWCPATSTVATLGSQDGDTNKVARVTIDSKAMRKIKPNQVLVFVAENVAVISTQTTFVVGACRVLISS